MLKYWSKIQLFFGILLLITVLIFLFFLNSLDALIIFMIIYAIELGIYAIFYIIVRIQSLIEFNRKK